MKKVRLALGDPEGHNKGLGPLAGLSHAKLLEIVGAIAHTNPAAILPHLSTGKPRDNRRIADMAKQALLSPTSDNADCESAIFTARSILTAEADLLQFLLEIFGATEDNRRYLIRTHIEKIIEKHTDPRCIVLLVPFVTKGDFYNYTCNHAHQSFSSESTKALCTLLKKFNPWEHAGILNTIASSPFAGEHGDTLNPLIIKHFEEIFQSTRGEPLFPYISRHFNDREIGIIFRNISLQIILDSVHSGLTSGPKYKFKTDRLGNATQAITLGLLRNGRYDLVVQLLDVESQGKALTRIILRQILVWDKETKQKDQEKVRVRKKSAEGYWKHHEKLRKFLNDPLKSVRLAALELIELNETPRATTPLRNSITAGESIDPTLLDRIFNEHPIGRRLRKQVLAEKINSLPFSLTGDQKKAFEEIARDMAGDFRMQRILQGDVGCGKTVVAFLAMWVAVKSKKQCCMLVPTSILAVQHFENAQKFFGNDLQVELMTAGMSETQKREQYQRLKNGTTKIVIGTSALLENDDQFHDLGLLVVDEQQKFGVNQRTFLTSHRPHVLEMTATPIPRSLQLKEFAVYDFSSIQELPPSRLVANTAMIMRDRVKNVIGQPKDRECLMYHVGKNVRRKGNQAFWICPKISDIEDVVSELQKKCPDLQVVGVHGKTRNKEAILAAFHAGEIHILVSTSIVNVGMDVAGANMMIVEDPLVYGISDLHQMRGRIGRTGQESYFYILEPKWSVNDRREAEQKERIDTILNSDDGFYIAEKDLQIRGPGQVYGTRQSGWNDAK